jgi:hypothetical protein
VYEEGVTKEEWIALVQAVMDEAEFPHEGCMSNLCGAHRELVDNLSTGGNDIHFSEQWFRYRFKLNKCCAYRSILSGWREVFVPQSYQEWFLGLAELGSGDVIPAPPVDLEDLAAHKQWLWTGIPPLCKGSSSSNSDPFDYEPMWSAWSNPVKVPADECGLVVLKNYFQICHGSLQDVMPEVLGQMNFSDDTPDDWTA